MLVRAITEQITMSEVGAVSATINPIRRIEPETIYRLIRTTGMTVFRFQGRFAIGLITMLRAKLPINGGRKIV